MNDFLLMKKESKDSKKYYDILSKLNSKTLAVKDELSLIRFLQCSSVRVIVIVFEFEKIDLVLLVKIIKSLTKAKLVIISDLDEATELELYENEVSLVFKTDVSSEILYFKLNKMLEELLSENSRRLVDDNFNIVVDLVNKTVTKDSTLVSLTNKEYDLLVYFLQNKNVVLTRKDIELVVWGNNIDEFDFRVVDIYVLKLRKKLNDKCIETTRGVGYMWPDKSQLNK